MSDRDETQQDDTTPGPEAPPPPDGPAFTPQPTDFQLVNVVHAAQWDARAGCVRFLPLALVTSPDLPRDPNGRQVAIPVPFDPNGCIYPERIREALTRAKLEAPAPRILVPKH